MKKLLLLSATCLVSCSGLNYRHYGRRPASYSDHQAYVRTAPFSWPLLGYVSSPFGRRRSQFHEGIDIPARQGTPVRASRSGHVIYAGNQIPGYGNLVILKHTDHFSTVYAHLSRIQVQKGQFATRGQTVGRVGKTGHATAPHLHFEIRNQQKAVDPLFYLQRKYAHHILNR